MNHSYRNERVFTGKTQIINLGIWAPDREIDNEKELGPLFNSLSINLDAMIKKTGVKKRRQSSASMTVLDMSELAVNDLLSRKNTEHFNPADIDTIIYASVSRMHAEPSTAILLQNRLGIESAISFDISNACLSFIDGLILADSLIATGRSELALIVSAEKGAQVAELSMDAIKNGNAGMECLAALTLGDGAAAALVSATDYPHPGILGLRAFTRTSRSQYAHCCTLQSTETPMITDSGTMFEGALLHYPSMLHALINKLGWSLDEIAALVPHQASLKIIQAGMESIGYPLEKTAISLDQYGNMASVSVPFTLSKFIDNKKPAPGSKIAITAFGSGLSFSMLATELL